MFSALAAQNAGGYMCGERADLGAERGSQRLLQIALCLGYSAHPAIVCAGAQLSGWFLITLLEVRLMTVLPGWL
jgi:hypothetical protein